MKNFLIIAAIVLAPALAIGADYNLIETEKRFGVDGVGKWTGAIVYTQAGCVPCKRLRAALEERSLKGWVVANAEDHKPAHWLFVEIDANESEHLGIKSTPTVRFFRDGKLIRSVKPTDIKTVSALVRLHPEVKPQAMASVSDDYDLSESSAAVVAAAGAAALKAQTDSARSEGYSSGYAAGARSANCSVSRSIILAGGPVYSYPATTYYSTPATTYYYAPNVSYSYGGYSSAAAAAPVSASYSYTSPLWGLFGSSHRSVNGPAAAFGPYGAYGASRACYGGACGF